MDIMDIMFKTTPLSTTPHRRIEQIKSTPAGDIKLNRSYKARGTWEGAVHRES